MTKIWMDDLINTLFQDTIDGWNLNIFVSGSFYCDNLNLKIVKKSAQF